MLFHFIVMVSNNVLFSLLPSKLIFLKYPSFFEFVTLFLKPRLSLLVAFLNVFDVVGPFSMRMIINSKRPLRSHEIRIRFLMVLCRNILSLEGQSDHCFNVKFLLFCCHEMAGVGAGVAILSFSMSSHSSFTQSRRLRTQLSMITCLS